MVVVLVGVYSIEEPEVPAAFGLLVHVCQFAMLAVLGVLFLTLDRISVRRLLQGMKRLRSGDTGESAAT